MGTKIPLFMQWPFVAFYPGSVAVSIGTGTWSALLLRDTPALSMPQSWHTSSTMCKMNAFAVAMSRKCSITVLYQCTVFCGWSSIGWAGPTGHPYPCSCYRPWSVWDRQRLSQPSVQLHPSPFSVLSYLKMHGDRMVEHTDTSRVSIYFTKMTGPSLIHLTEPLSHLLVRVFALPHGHP